MYPSSSYQSRRAPESSGSMMAPGSRRDERLSSGPLTNERARMEQIRSMLEKTQRRMARQTASSTSHHSYNSRSGAPMSMGIPSSSNHHKYPSSRHPHSRHPPASNSSDMFVGSTHYFPPDYTSGRAPRVKSVYLEDLSSAISSNQPTAPYSRGPTSYAPGSGLTAAPPSKSHSYYAPLDETARSHRTTHRVHQNYEAAPGAPVHVRSERHDVHELRHHHQHHHHRDEVEKPSATSSHRHTSSRQHHHHYAEDPKQHRTPSKPLPQPPQRQPSDVAPPPSTRGILRKPSTERPPPSANMPQFAEDAPPSSNFDSSNFLLYANSHGNVPKSRRGGVPPAPPSSSRQPLAPNGQPERSALKQQREYLDNDEEEYVAPPPSSRVRFHDELLAPVYPPLVEEDEETDDTDNEELEFLGEEVPYNPADDMVYGSDEEEEINYDQPLDEFPEEDGDEYPYDQPRRDDTTPALGPAVEIKQSRVVEAETPKVVEDTQKAEKTSLGASANASPPIAEPPSPEPKKKTRANSDKDKDPAVRQPHRRRGSSAARTPPNLSPSTTHTRKSLTEPPKSAIDVSAFGQYDLRERRASKERRTSNASNDPNVAQDVLGFSQEKPLRRSGVSESKSMMLEEFVEENRLRLSSGPFGISLLDGYESPDQSNGSLHESDLAFDDDEVPSVPSEDFASYPGPKSDSGSEEESRKHGEEEKLSPSSTEEYLDARGFSEEDEEPIAILTPADTTVEPVSQALPNGDHRRSTASRPSPAKESKVVPPLPPKSAYENLWKVAYPKPVAKDKAEPEAEPARVNAGKVMTVSRVNGKASKEEISMSAVKASAVPRMRETSTESPPSSPDLPPARPASKVAATIAPRQPSDRRHQHSDQNTLLTEAHAQLHSQRTPSKPMPLSQSLMLMMPPPSTTRSSHRPPPVSTHIRPSPATARPSVTRTNTSLSGSMSNNGVPRAPKTVDGSSAYVPRRLRPKSNALSLRKAMPPSIGALSGLASGPVTFELNMEWFYEIEWQTGEFGFSFQRVYVEDVSEDGSPGSRRMFLRMLLNTERGTCPSFKQVHVGDVLIEIGGTRVCDIKLDQNGGGSALTKFFTELRSKTPLRLVFQRMDPMEWEGGVEL